MTAEHRHAQLELVERYLQGTVPGAISVAGEPAAKLLVNPGRPSLSIRLRAEGEIPDLSGFRNLGLESLLDGTLVAHQLTVTLENNHVEVYAWLCSVLDRVQLGGEPFGTAVSTSVDSLTGILSLRRGLTAEQQTGLFGELLALLALSDGSSAAAALDAWRGPQGEEHDFGDSAHDIEVKSTLGERRQHWIAGTGQLVPTGDRPLYLLSFQLTAAAVDSGRTLPDLVEYVRRVVGSSGNVLESRLVSVGYRDSDSALYRSRWTLRTRPAAFSVSEEFPAVTQRRIDQVVPSAERITDLRYRVDMTGMDETNDILELGGPLFMGALI